MNPNPRKARMITKIFVLQLSLLFFVSCACLKSIVKEQPAAPHMIWEERIYDFGIAGPEEEITHTFIFTNAGSLPLKIHKVTTDCGCTAALSSEKKIPPGGFGEIRAVFETRRYEGEQEKHITVHSNDPDEPEIELTIKGTIKRDVAVLPQGINFGDVDKRKTASGRVRILQLSKKSLTLEKVEANERYFAVTTSRFREENNKGFNIDVSLTQDVPVGRLNEVITLHTNLKRRPRIDIPIWANILGRIHVKPEALSFGVAHKGEKISKTITIFSKDDTEFQILKVVCDLPFLRFETPLKERKSSFKVRGVVDDISPAGRVSAQLEIYTDDPDQKAIRVPVYGVVQSR